MAQRYLDALMQHALSGNNGATLFFRDGNFGFSEDMLHHTHAPSHHAHAHGSSSQFRRPQFRSKVVNTLFCKSCPEGERLLCRRAMRALLLSDTQTELYSTDTPPTGVQLVNDDYTTKNCLCRIRDIACLGCGNVVGYHVTQPCSSCMESNHNGHFFMFLVDAITPAERYDADSGRPLLWAHLPAPDRDEPPEVEKNTHDCVCR